MVTSCSFFQSVSIGMSGMIFIWQTHAEYKEIGSEMPRYDFMPPTLILIGEHEKHKFASKEEFSNYKTSLGVKVRLYDDS